MNWLMIVLKALPTVISLIGLAEKVIVKEGTKTGTEKKVFVKEGTKAIVNVMEDVSTGGQKETWEQIDSIIDPFIDIACKLMFWKR